MRSSSQSSWKDWLLGGVIILALVSLLWWFIFGYWLDNDDRIQRWFIYIVLDRWFFPGGINPVHFPWYTWLIGCILAMVLVAFVVGDSSRDRINNILGYGAVIAAIIMFVLSIFTFCTNLNDFGASYAGSTTFIVEDARNTPDSLKRLVKDTNPDEHGCALYAHNDMRGCINEGSFDYEWDARVASAMGATVVIERSSEGSSNTKILSDTLTYIYEEDGRGTWTAIRDGKTKEPIYGVASWNGEGNVETCTFRGQYRLNKAFGGRWGTNLSDEIADKYPNLFYSSGDRYGYCQGRRPVIVIPVKRQITFRQRTTFRSAGVLVITGSPSGKAQYSHVTDVRPGDYPGPVYPASLAADQRESMGTIAGLGDSLFGNFGYEPTDAITQAGNNSEYQLRDKATGRIYWVTPMKSRSSDAQVLTAYAVIPADEAKDGALNEQSIYVLPEGDVRAVNLDDLEARTRQALTQAESGFYPAGGQLTEFLPIGRGTWQVYGELNGRVAYRITISSDARIKPTVTSLSSSSEKEESESTTQPLTSSCREDLRELSDKDLVQCLSDVSDELEARQEP